MQPSSEKLSSLSLAPIRGKHRSGGHDSSSGWAISYADLLMVLLCLFIGLSVVDEENPSKGDSLLKEISVSFQKGDVGISTKDGVETKKINGDVIEVVGSDGKTKLIPNPEAKTIESTIYESLSESLEKIGIQSELMQERNEILLKFEYNLFQKGQIHLDAAAKEKIQTVLDSLKQFQGKIMLSVVGHTDRTPIKTSKSKAIQENIDLAVLRASYATKWIRDTGFPAQDLRIEVSDPQADDRRSLSLHVLVKHIAADKGAKK